MRVYIYFLLLLILAGCSAVYDPYSLTSRSSNYYLENGQNERAEGIYCKAVIPEKFQSDEPLTLAELIDIALINNPETKKTWAEAKAAAAEYGVSLSNYF